MSLETYTTPLDEEDSEIDEYVIFKQVLQCKYFSRVQLVSNELFYLIIITVITSSF